jgi:hypothetical protein
MPDQLDFLVMVLARVDFSRNEAAGRIRDLAIERVCAATLDQNAGELLRE